MAMQKEILANKLLKKEKVFEDRTTAKKERQAELVARKEKEKRDAVEAEKAIKSA